MTKKKDEISIDVNQELQIMKLTALVEALKTEADNAYQRGFQRGHAQGRKEAEIDEIYLTDEEE